MNLLTIQESADLMKVSESTVRRLIRSGRLPAYKVGERGQVRVKATDLESYVDSQRVPIASALSDEITENEE